MLHKDDLCPHVTKIVRNLFDSNNHPYSWSCLGDSKQSTVVLYGRVETANVI